MSYLSKIKNISKLAIWLAFLIYSAVHFCAAAEPLGIALEGYDYPYTA
jgi:hypothetical protein